MICGPVLCSVEGHGGGALAYKTDGHRIMSGAWCLGAWQMPTIPCRVICWVSGVLKLAQPETRLPLMVPEISTSTRFREMEFNKKWAQRQCCIQALEDTKAKPLRRDSSL